MKEQAILKINRMGKIGQIISNICIVLLAIAIVVLIVAILTLALMPKDFITFVPGGTAAIEVDLEKIGYHLSEQDRQIIESGEGGKLSFDGYGNFLGRVKTTESSISFAVDGDMRVDLHSFSWRLIPALLAAAFMLISVCFAAALCKAFSRCASPFEDRVVHKLRMLAFSLIPWTVLSSLVKNGTLWNLRAVNIHIGVDLGIVLVVLIIFALSYIFKYGAVLQRESDETL